MTEQPLLVDILHDLLEKGRDIYMDLHWEMTRNVPPAERAFAKHTGYLKDVKVGPPDTMRPKEGPLVFLHFHSDTLNRDKTVAITYTKFDDYELEPQGDHLLLRNTDRPADELDEAVETQKLPAEDPLFIALLKDLLAQGTPVWYAGGKYAASNKPVEVGDISKAIIDRPLASFGRPRYSGEAYVVRMKTSGQMNPTITPDEADDWTIEDHDGKLFMKRVDL